MKPPGTTVHGAFCLAGHERDNPYDARTRPAEHAAWHDAFQAVRREQLECAPAAPADLTLREDAAVLPQQCEFALIWRPFQHPFRLRVNDVVRLDGRLGRVLRVTDCAAVVLLNRRFREFTTRFDKPVRFQPSPAIFRIWANSEIEILNRPPARARRRAPRQRPVA